jgi:hypothetical protein
MLTKYLFQLINYENKIRNKKVVLRELDQSPVNRIDHFAMTTAYCLRCEKFGESENWHKRHTSYPPGFHNDCLKEIKIINVSNWAKNWMQKRKLKNKQQVIDF